MMRGTPYWTVERLAGEDEESFETRAGLIYIQAQQQEIAEWWRRLGSEIDLRGRRVLDLGCGHGALSIDAAARGADSVTGIDLDASRVRFARRYLQDHHPDLAETVRFLELDLDGLAAGETFDIVLSKDTFEHVQGLERLLAEVARRVRPGGLLVCGFSPLYYSPNGDHARYRLPLPWLHVLLPPRLVFCWASRRLGRRIHSAEDVGLNRLTLPEFERMLPAAIWERVSLRVNPIAHRLRPVFDLLRLIRPLERYFTVGVYGVFRRPGPAPPVTSLRTATGIPAPSPGCDTTTSKP